MVSQLSNDNKTKLNQILNNTQIRRVDEGK